MTLRRDQGIVLRGYPFGEADRIVLLISPNHGLVRAVAKGVRRTKSRFGGRLEPLTHVDLVLFQGRNLATITQVSVIEPFPRLRGDLDAVLVAGTMAEAISKVIVEGEPSHRLFLLLQRGLQALEHGAGGLDLVASFLLKLMDALGQAPALRHCAACGRKNALDRFSLVGGGLVCSTCDIGGTFRLREGLTLHLARLSDADFLDLKEPDSDLAADAVGLARRFVEFHIEVGLAGLAYSNIKGV
ncbi:MAG: DNA repair protein RecO [bacterium]|nr:DNA repair protein RecO [bacterium]MDE0288282.1 DNA repair protein RecO [bacterium]MDE0437316.1 DNA repair protein RecO [bacterium]